MALISTDEIKTFHTILNGGKVYAIEPENVPDKAPVAAILRY